MKERKQSQISGWEWCWVGGLGHLKQEAISIGNWFLQLRISQSGCLDHHHENTWELTKGSHDCMLFVLFLILIQMNAFHISSFNIMLALSVCMGVYVCLCMCVYVYKKPLSG